MPYTDMGAYEFFIAPQGNPPYITSAREVNAGAEPFTYTATAQDPNGDAISFYFPHLPGWLTVSGNALSGTALPSSWDTILTVVASDGHLANTATVRIHNQRIVIPKDGQWSIFNAANGLENAHITCIEVGAAGVKWIGTNGGGLYKFANGTWTAYTTTNSGLTSDSIRAVYEDSDRTVYVGTHRKGLVRFDGTTWQQIDIGSTIHAVQRDARGTLWVGGEGYYQSGSGYLGFGLANRADTGWTVHRQIEGTSIYHVQDIATTPSGQAWFAIRPVDVVNMSGQPVVSSYGVLAHSDSSGRLTYYAPPPYPRPT